MSKAILYLTLACLVTTKCFSAIDLSVFNYSLSVNSIMAGNTLKVYCSERNLGSTSAGSNVISIHISDNTTLTPGLNGDTYLGEIPISSCAAGATTSIYNIITLNIPNNYTTKTYYIFFSADGGQTITESNELNNFSYLAINVTACSMNTPAGLTPGGISSSPTVISTTLPNLQWNSVLNAKYYGVYIRDVVTNQLIYNNDAATSTNSFSVPNGVLTVGGQYKWNCLAKSDFSNSSCLSSGATTVYFNVASCTQATNANTSLPKNISTEIGSTATFDVSVTGTPPFNYYWYDKNLNVVKTTLNSSSLTNSYKTSTLDINDDGNSFYCVINNCGQIESLVSRTATLAVTQNCVTPSTPGIPSKNSPSCGDVTLSRSGTVPSNETWYWQGNSCGTDKTLGSASTYNVSSTGTYYIRAYNNTGGCWSTDCSSIDVTVKQNPIVTASSNSPITPPETLNLIATSFAGATYLWSGPNFTSATQNPVVTPTNSSVEGNYCVTATANGCSTQSCTTVDINIPVPTINAITFTNKVENHSGISQSLITLNSPIKICADGSTATYIKVNASDVTNIGFRILDENNVPITDPDKDGKLGDSYTFNGTNIEIPYTHPQFMNANNGFRTFTLQILFKGSPLDGYNNIPLNIYKAPILFVHGLWGGESSFGPMFYDFINTSYTLERLMYRVDYEGDDHGAARSFASNSNVLWRNIDNLLNQVRDNNFSAGKVDIIAHSMGGILSRSYINDKNRVKYRDDVHVFLAIDVPNSGTQAANLLSGPWGIETSNFLNSIDNKTDLGAIEDLKVNSSAMVKLNTPPLINHHVPTFAIKSYINFKDAKLSDGNHDKFIIDYAYTRKLCPYGVQLDIHNPTDLLNFIYYGENSDLIVPVSSQAGNLNNTNDTNFPNVHTASKSDYNIIDQLKLKLNQNPNNNSFFDKIGFIPDLLEHKLILDSPPNGGVACKPLGGNINITSPLNNSIISNSNLDLSLVTSGNINRIAAKVFNYDQHIFTVDSFNTSLELSVPLPLFASGHYRVIAMGYDSLLLIAIDTINIFISTNAGLDSIQITPDHLHIPTNESMPVTIEGYYTDGIKRKLTDLPGINYSLADTTVAQYYSGRSISGKEIGSTSLTISYLGKSQIIPVDVYPPSNSGSASFTCPTNRLCGYDSINFRSNSTSTPLSLKWQFDGGIPATSALPNPTVTYITAGKYKVSLVAVYSTYNDTLNLPDYIIVDSVNRPLITLTHSGDSTILVSTPENNYQWYKNGQAIHESNNQNLVAKYPGIYNVQTTNINGCLSETSSALIIPGVYTFIGGGFWNNENNWSNNNIPPSSLPSGSEIIINPSGSGECILNVAQTISYGTSLSVEPDKKFIIEGSLFIKSDSVNLANGLVALYPFNGNANDESANNHNGTVAGATLINDRFGKDASAYSFNGINDKIQLDLQQTDLTSYSVSAWFKTSTGGPILAGRGMNNQVGLTLHIYNILTGGEINAGKASFVADGSAISIGKTSDLTYNDNQWHHIVGVFNGATDLIKSSQFKIYIDNVFVPQENNDVGTATIPINNLTNLLIGAHQVWPDGGLFHGELDDIGIWNRALSQAEINYLYTH